MSPTAPLRSFKTAGAPRVAIVGVTGAVGQEFLRVLTERKFPYSAMKMLASARSAGKPVQFQGETYTSERPPGPPAPAHRAPQE